jgi:TolB-like protein
MNTDISKTLWIPVLAFALIMCASCVQQKKTDMTGPPPVDLIAEAHNASVVLANELKASMRHDVPIIVTSLVNIDDVQQSSRFGRIFSELLASELSKNEFLVKEIKMAQKDIFVRKQSGEFALSRDLMDIAASQNVQAVVVGTYATASNSVYLSVRMIGSKDDLVLSSWNRAILLDSNIRTMLRDSQEPSSSVGSLSAEN